MKITLTASVFSVVVAFSQAAAAPNTEQHHKLAPDAMPQPAYLIN